jgi:hypothetical protein
MLCTALPLHDDVLQIVLGCVRDIAPNTLLFDLPRVNRQFRMACKGVVGVHVDLLSFPPSHTVLATIIGQFPLLVHLSIPGPTDADLVVVGAGCRSLTRLRGYGGLVTEAGVDALTAGCPAIESMQLEGVVHGDLKVADTGAAMLADRCRVTTFDLSGSLVTDHGVAQLAARGLLVDITLQDCPITDAALHALAASCPGLKRADFGQCGDVTDDGLVALAGACRDLELLIVWECDITTTGYAAAMGCPKLVCWNSGYCDIDNLRTVPIGCPLVDITFAGCPGISDECVWFLATACTGLTDVNLTGCLALTDACLVSLAGYCCGLQELNVGGCVYITDHGVNVLFAGCVALTHVDFSACPLLTDEAAMVVATCDNRLVSVDFTECNQMTETARDTLAVMCPGLVRLHFDKCNAVSEPAIYRDAERTHTQAFEAYAPQWVGKWRPCTQLEVAQLTDDLQCLGLQPQPTRECKDDGHPTDIANFFRSIDDTNDCHCQKAAESALAGRGVRTVQHLQQIFGRYGHTVRFNNTDYMVYACIMCNWGIPPKMTLMTVLHFRS